LYYETLGANGYEKSDQIPKEDIQKLYDAMVEAHKAMKVPVPKKEEEPKPEPEKKPDDESEDQSLGFSTDEMEKEGQSEFPPLEEKKEEKKEEEKPLQREIMSLTGLEAILVDKHKFSADQIIGRLKELFGEDDVTKLTRKQVQEATKHFEGIIAQLNKVKEEADKLRD
jgi:hypothetical protein